MKSHWKFGTAVICAASLASCNGKENPKQDAAIAKAPTPGSSVTADNDKGVWPNPDIMLLTADAAGQSKNVLRVHMDVGVSRISSELESALSGGNGHDILEQIKPVLILVGTPVSWATLKAALRCYPAELGSQDTDCSSTSAPSGPLGDWPKPNVLLMKDYGLDGTVKNVVRVQMDIRLARGRQTQDAVENALLQRTPKAVLDILVNDNSIYPVVLGKSPGWATLKAALGCTHFEMNATTCN